MVQVFVWLVMLFFSVETRAHPECEEINIKQLLGAAQKRSMHVLVVPKPSCIEGHSQIYPFHVWSSIKVDLDFDIKDSQLFQADSCKSLLEVRNRTFAKRILSWFADPDIITSKYFYLSPFGQTCFEVTSRDDLRNAIKLSFETVTWHLPLYFIIGLILFFEADRLSRSTTFFYSSGILLGVGFSLLLAIFLLHRLVPSKGGAYAVLAGGWSMSLFLLQWTWNNLVDLVLDKNPIVIGYFTLAGLVSFCLCYYNGPVTNERGIDLIRWTIQLIASYFIYKGVQPESLSLTVVTLVIVCYGINTSHLNVINSLLYILPKSWVSYKVRYYFFPPPNRLLTVEEYDLQGTDETCRALLQLREYCNSPECDSWKMMSRIRNPKRFCAFVTEGLHITDDEYEQYEENPFSYSDGHLEHDDEKQDAEEGETNRFFERYIMRESETQEDIILD